MDYVMKITASLQFFFFIFGFDLVFVFAVKMQPSSKKFAKHCHA
jgi:hypothetical protein